MSLVFASVLRPIESSHPREISFGRSYLCSCSSYLVNLLPPTVSLTYRSRFTASHHGISRFTRNEMTTAVHSWKKLFFFVPFFWQNNLPHEIHIFQSNKCSEQTNFFSANEIKTRLRFLLLKLTRAIVHEQVNKGKPIIEMP